MEYRVLQPPNNIYKNEDVKNTPVEVLITIKEEYPINGGSYRYYKGMKYTMKGCVYERELNDLTIVKGFIKPILFILKDNRLISAITLFFPKFRDNLINHLIGYIDKTLKKHYSYDRIYCESGREIKKVADEIFDGEKNKKIIEFLTFVWEKDIPYRFKGQDFFDMINRKAVLKDPAEEIRRTLNKVRMREVPQGTYLTKMWDTIGKIIYATLRTNKDFKKKVIKFFSMIDYDKIKMDNNDMYYALMDSHYDFLGLPLSERMKIRENL